VHRFSKTPRIQILSAAEFLPLAGPPERDDENFSTIRSVRSPDGRILPAPMPCPVVMDAHIRDCAGLDFIGRQRRELDESSVFVRREVDEKYGAC
jgi:hypothetical protein